MRATILAVDDESDNLRIICDYLRQSNPDYRILQAKNGKIALKIVKKELPDLVLTDWNMPIMTGLELLNAIKSEEKCCDIPVIMQTANTEDNHLKQAFDAGATDYIKKPISQVELLARVRSSLALSQAKQQTEILLRNILPKEIADDLKTYGKTEAKHYELVSVLFADFKGFTQIAEQLSPREIIENLNTCFLAFDEICERHHLEKIKTIGDAYMCAGGIPVENTSSPIDCTLAAFEMQNWMKTWQAEKEAKGEKAWELRLGIHSGPVVAGVIGKNKFAYDIWGSTVNLAARMESSGVPGKINISGPTFELIKHEFDCSYRGKVQVKNKGEVDMYFVEGIA
ncbi:MAG: adenylate/guanylate cyclase domain-containing protein [Bacteroidota bacterium]